MVDSSTLSSPYLCPGILDRLAASPPHTRLESLLSECQEKNCLQIIHIEQSGDFQLKLRISDGKGWLGATMPRYKRKSAKEELDLLNELLQFSLIGVTSTTGHPKSGDLKLLLTFKPPARQLPTGRMGIIGSPRSIFTPSMVNTRPRGQGGKQHLPAPAPVTPERDHDQDVMIGLRYNTEKFPYCNVVFQR